MRSLFLTALLVAACSGGVNKPTPTGAVCPTPDPMTLTWDNFGQPFMAKYCTACHSSTLVGAQRNGAPKYHDFETLELSLNFANHVDEYAGSGPNASNNAMPSDRCPTDPGGELNRDCPQPTEEERMNLSMWLACEVNRPHSF